MAPDHWVGAGMPRQVGAPLLRNSPEMGDASSSRMAEGSSWMSRGVPPAQPPLPGSKEPNEDHHAQRLTEMRKRIAALRTRLERLLLWRVWERMLEIEFVDRSVALAGKAFVSFFPLVIVVAAFVPDRIRSSIITTVTARLGIRGRRARRLPGRPSRRRTTSARRPACSVSCSRSSSRPRSRPRCSASTSAPGGDRPRAGAGAYWRGATWLLAMLASMALLGALRGALGGGLGLGLFAVVSLAATSGLWWFTAWFLLLGEVRARVLVPTGVITGIAMAGYAASATVWMPERGDEQRSPVRLLRRRPRAGDLVLRRRDLHPDRRVRRTGPRRGHRAGRHAHPRRRRPRR